MTTMTQKGSISSATSLMNIDNTGTKIRDQKLLHMIGGLYAAMIILCAIIPFTI